MTVDPEPRDDSQRLAAINPAHSFIVQAPAGSGKTELLIQRYLRLLAIVGEPEEVIAITFTRKAASEMRGRVLKALREAATDNPPPGAHESRTRELALAALTRDGDRRWKLKDNPARLRIQTIDSLCARLSQQMPLLSRFGAHLEPVDDAEALYREAARELLAELESESAWTPALGALLRHLDNKLDEIETLLADMLGRRDQWLRHVADGDHESARRKALEKGLQNVIGDALQDLAAQMPAELKEGLVSLARYAAGNLKRDSIESPIVACDGLNTLPGAALADLGVWLGIAELLLTANGEWRKKCDKHIGFPASDKDKQLDALCKERKQTFKSLLDACGVNSALRDCLCALRGLPAAHYSDAQWEIMQALFQLLRVAAAHLELAFQSRAQVDFTGVAQRARDALGSPEEPTDLALTLDYRIRHILIDEFQDTSLGQCRLLEGLTAGWENGDGRTLFAVGDPMQSIYGFREAEVGVFLRVRSRGIGNIKPLPLTLSANFRSQRGIVTWINQTFPRVFPQVEDMTAGAVAYTSCDAVHEGLEGHAVQTHCFIDNKKVQEAQRVVELVRQARNENPAGTIAILVRGKNHLMRIVPKLNAVSLRFRAIEIDKLGDRPVVQDLLALTRALSHPADRLSWLSLLRAPWCGLTLHDLHALAGDDRHRPLCELMMDENGCAHLSADGQRRLARVREVLAESHLQRRRRRLRRQVEGAWLALGGPATASRLADIEDARTYFELLEQCDDGGELTDFAALRAGVETLYAAPDSAADEKLQIMTIHKAKGLEFDTVIVPGLGHAPRGEPHGLLAWLERVNRDGATDLLIAPIAARAESEAEVTYSAIRRLTAAKTQHEDARLLYVAATRARRRLHLLGHAKLTTDGACKAASRSLLASLWPVVEDDFVAAAAAPSEAPTADESAAAATPRLRRFSTGWRLPSPPRGVDVTAAPALPVNDSALYDIEFMWAGETARLVGIMTHRLLQGLARDGIARWDAARLKNLRRANIAALTALGARRDELDSAVARVERALLNTLDDVRGRWLFNTSHAQARAEYALSGIVDGRLINIKIDRTFVDHMDVRWIIDYKTGTHEGADIEAFLDREEERYRSQLARYAVLMRAKESRPIRAGLYYPLIPGGWREWLAE